jgi:hypothetical protein
LCYSKTEAGFTDELLDVVHSRPDLASLITRVTCGLDMHQYFRDSGIGG